MLTSSGNSNTNNSKVPDPVAPAQASVPHQSAGTNILSEPIEVAKFWRNRRGEAIYCTVKKIEGRPVADIRVHAGDGNGKLVPTSKGFALVPARLADLERALLKTLRKARELGLTVDSSS